MTRPLAVAALLVLPVVASAQTPAPITTPVPPGYNIVYGPPEIGGHLVSGPAIVGGGSALFPVETPIPRRFSVGGGAKSGYPQVWLPSGPWGGVNYKWPESPVFIEPAPTPVVTAPARPTTTYPQLGASGQTKATIVVQFPAAAEVWLDGKKSEGNQATEWTLTSQALDAGKSHTFEVKGKWKVGEKTYESTQSLTVAAGDRNRSIILSGTEVRPTSDPSVRK